MFVEDLGSKRPKLSSYGPSVPVRTHPYTGWLNTPVLRTNFFCKNCSLSPPLFLIRYLMRKRGGEREQFLQKKLVLRTGVLSHPVYGWVRTGTDGPYELSFGRFDPKSSTNT